MITAKGLPPRGKISRQFQQSKEGDNSQPLKRAGKETPES